MAWNAETVFPNEGLWVLDDACQAEIAAVAQVLRDNPLQTEALHAKDFEMLACTALMADVRETLDHEVAHHLGISDERLIELRRQGPG